MASSRRVAVTGGTGFLGRAILNRIAESAQEPIAVARGRRRGPPLGFELRYADLEDPGSWRDVFDGCDAVIHAAAGISYWERDRGWLERLNVLGTRYVCEEALRAGVKGFVHVSSVSAIGPSPSGEPLDETSAFTANRLRIGYFDTKRDAEVEVQRAVEKGLPATIVNPGAIFGPSEVRSNTNDFLAMIARGRLPFVPSGRLNLIDRESVAEGVVLALEKGEVGQRYLLTGESLSYWELFGRVARCGGRRRWRWPMPDGAVALMRGLAIALDAVHLTRPPFTREALWALTLEMCFTNERARKVLGWKPRPLEEALSESVEWVRHQSPSGPSKPRTS